MEENKKIEEDKKEETVNETPVENSVKEEKPKNNKDLIIALVTIIVLLIALVVYLLLFNKPNEEKPVVTPQETNSPQETTKPLETPQESTKPEPTGKHDLIVYKHIDGNNLVNENKKLDYTTAAFTIKVNSDKAKVLAVSYFSNDLVLYSDDGLYVYDNKTKTSQKMDLADTYKEYLLFLSEDDSKAIGIAYNDNGKFGYYNINKKQKLYTNKYTYDNNLNVTQINDHYLSLRENNMLYLLSSDAEAVRLSYKDEGSFLNYVSFGENGNYIFGLADMVDLSYIERLYSKNYQMFYGDDLAAISLSMISFCDNNLYFVKDNKLYKYNTNGDLISTNSNYSDVKLLANNMIVYIKDGNVVAENILDSKDSKVITTWNDKWEFDIFDSGYYTRFSLDRLGEKNKKEGLYIVYEYGYDSNGNAVKDSKGYYGMEYCLTPSKEIVTYPIKEEVGGRAKPVLYLYPEKETNVTVKFEKPGLLTTTYPKYINSWNVKVLPNGDMYDKDGKYYYALYWDEKRYNEVDFHEGFYVEGKDVIKFLEEKLTYIGLSDKERNEFIMYWLPIMENNKKNLVYFELTKERELGNKLIITPKPDSLLRVSIHIKKVNEKVIIPEQKLKTFKRVGFTAVEWGGMTY